MHMMVHQYVKPPTTGAKDLMFDALVSVASIDGLREKAIQ